jgi:hypothetical protein
MIWRFARHWESADVPDRALSNPGQNPIGQGCAPPSDRLGQTKAAAASLDACTWNHLEAAILLTPYRGTVCTMNLLSP